MVGAVAPRVQRVMVPGGERTWTLLGVDHRRVEPVEEFLEYLRLRRMSPNTVKSYTRALGMWWEFLALLDLAWDDVTVEDFGRFQTRPRVGARVSTGVR